MKEKHFFLVPLFSFLLHFSTSSIIFIELSASGTDIKIISAYSIRVVKELAVIVSFGARSFVPAMSYL